MPQSSGGRGYSGLLVKRGGFIRVDWSGEVKRIQTVEITICGNQRAVGQSGNVFGPSRHHGVGDEKVRIMRTLAVVGGRWLLGSEGPSSHS